MFGGPGGKLINYYISPIYLTITKKSYFGGIKTPEGMPKRRHWLGGRVYPLQTSPRWLYI